MSEPIRNCGIQHRALECILIISSTVRSMTLHIVFDTPALESHIISDFFSFCIVVVVAAHNEESRLLWLVYALCPHG